jgi:hypothetical protein
MVKEGFSGTWLWDCGPNLDDAALAEFLILWQVLPVVQLAPDREDALLWSWSGDGVYSSKSAYNAFFAGRTHTTTVSQVWRSCAPYGCKFFCGLSRGTDVGRHTVLSVAASHGLQHAHSVTRSRRRFNTFLLAVWLPERCGRWRWTGGIGWPGCQWPTPTSYSGGPLGLVRRRRGEIYGPPSSWSSAAFDDNAMMWSSTELGRTWEPSRWGSGRSTAFDV